MPDDHLDDELLSAVIDGLDADGAHLVRCQRCAGRLDHLRAGATLVATPVSPLAADDVDRLVTAALAAPAEAPVIPLRRTIRRPPAPWLAAVAAAALLVVGLPVLLRSGGAGDGGRETASRESDAALNSTADDAAVSPAGGAGGATAGGTTEEGLQTTSEAFDSAAPASGARATGAATDRYQEDLGAQDNPDALASTLRARLSTGPPAAYDSADGSTPRCVDAARELGAGRLGSLTYSARLRWRGADAEALVFVLTEPSEAATHQAYVLSTSECDVLAEPRF